MTAVEEFADRLRSLREGSKASLRDLEQVLPYSRSTIQDKLSGRSLPDWPFVEAVVKACADHAGWPAIVVNLPSWQSDYQRAAREVEEETDRLRREAAAARALARAGASVSDRVAAARMEYLGRVRSSYRQLNLEVLLTMTDLDERLQVPLREVFVPQRVRVDPPPVEVPRELRRRLVDSGQADTEDLPEGLDPQVLDQLRTAYRDRPARPVLEVLTDPAAQRVVLLGDPGAGKSTLARYLTLALADLDPALDTAVAGTVDPDQAGGLDGGPLAGLAGWLPLVVELRSYAAPQWQSSTFVDFLDHLHATEGLGLPRTVLEDVLASERVVVVFDGLDEVFDADQRRSITRQIAGFASRYPQARIVVTSRVIGYQRQILDDAGFALYMLQDLDPAQINTFVHAWYTIACPDPNETQRMQARLLQAVRDSAAVAELAGNPLLLTILAIIGRRRELPRDRAMVYEYAVSLLVEHWDTDIKCLAGDRVLTHRDKLELLRLLARRMQAGNGGLAGNRIAEQDLRATFEAYLHDPQGMPPREAALAADTMIKQLRERNFILSRFGAGMYGFVHRAFLEYLAAADIVHQFDNRILTEQDLTDLFTTRGGDPAWQEVLLLLTGMKDHFAAGILDHLLAADPSWRLPDRTSPFAGGEYRHTLLAVRCLREIRPATPRPQHQAVAAAITWLLEAAHTREIRVFDLSLAETLAQTILPVFGVLGPRWAGATRYQTWYLTRGQYLSPPLFGGDGVADVAARLHLALLPADASTLNYARQLAVHARQPPLRRAAVQAIAAGWADDEGTLPLLRERATTDPDNDVRQAAVQAIATGWADDEGTQPLLRERATTDP
ncbi:MAG TPA: helix-turn-helix domain-containing protein, partial [Kineosporiaceae bacterium]|nr:helix-turn-helix domain-containing protein [Kineosporiaceae bacterium]